MENSSSSKPQDRENPSPINSPNSHGNNCMSSSSNNSNGFQIPTPPLTPKPFLRSDPNPYPTTFVQADTTTFKQVVQMLTGSSDTKNQTLSSSPKRTPPPQPPQDPFPTASPKTTFNIPPVKTQQKKQGFKLYERRSNIKNSLMINTLIPNFAYNSGLSPRKPEILSPSLLDFPSLTLSPVTPLNEDPFDKSSPSNFGGNSSEEERAIAEKGFYLHPSPITTPRDSEPQLLPLFPVSSPKISGSSS